MLTDSSRKSVCLIRIILCISILTLCAAPTNGFAKEDSNSSSPSSKELVKDKELAHESEKIERDWYELEESQSKDVTESQAVKAENYNQAWDDAMVAAPAFGE